MKRKVFSVVMASIIAICSNVVSFADNEISIMINGDRISLDQPPIAESGRTLVPLRAIFENLDAQVEWEQETQTITATKEDNNIKLKLNDTVAYVNGNKTVLDVPAKAVNGRTLVPTRFVAESMDCNVDWDNTTKTVLIDHDNFYLPDEFCVATLKTLTIYNKNVACTNYEQYKYKWSCEIGKENSNGFTYTGYNSEKGNHKLTLEVYNKKNKLVYKKEANLKVVDNSFGNDKKVLIIGDHLINSKKWITDIVIDSNNRIEYVGTRGVEGAKHEGRSGFSARDYILGRQYLYENELNLPFWDGERFNWQYYKDTTKINPDIVIILLGINGVSDDPTNNADSILKMVELIRQDDPNIPIFVVNSIYRGKRYEDEECKAVDIYETNREHRMIFRLANYINSRANEDNFNIIPACFTFDSDENFPKGDYLSPKYNTGYSELENIVYSTLCAYSK